MPPQPALRWQAAAPEAGAGIRRWQHSPAPVPPAPLRAPRCVAAATGAGAAAGCCEWQASTTSSSGSARQSLAHTQQPCLGQTPIPTRSSRHPTSSSAISCFNSTRSAPAPARWPARIRDRAVWCPQPASQLLHGTAQHAACIAAQHTACSNKCMRGRRQCTPGPCMRGRSCWGSSPASRRWPCRVGLLGVAAQQRRTRACCRSCWQLMEAASMPLTRPGSCRP